jgi:hypothetical protein
MQIGYRFRGAFWPQVGAAEKQHAMDSSWQTQQQQQYGQYAPPSAPYVSGYAPQVRRHANALLATADAVHACVSARKPARR